MELALLIQNPDVAAATDVLRKRLALIEEKIRLFDSSPRTKVLGVPKKDVEWFVGVVTALMFLRNAEHVIQTDDTIANRVAYTRAVAAFVKACGEY